MYKACINCKNHLSDGSCAREPFETREDNLVEEIVDYVIGDGILADGLREPIESVLKYIEDDTLEYLIDAIEKVVRSKITDEVKAEDSGCIISNPREYCCNDWE